MITTSLKLSDDLKDRAVQAAQSQGVSTHAFMVDAIERAAAAAESRANFVIEAQFALEQMLNSGRGFEAADVHAYIKARVAGTKTSKPKEKNWRG